MNTPKISMVRFGAHGWAWLVKGGQYRTNSEGDGLWEWRHDGTTFHVYWDYDTGEEIREPAYAWKQIQDTSQYFLPKDRKKAYDKLYREWFRSDQGDNDD